MTFRRALDALICVSALFLTAVPRLAAEEYAPLAWLDTPAAIPYAVVRDDLASVFREARDKGVPSPVLWDRLQEGSAKHVSPQSLYVALRAEADRAEAVVGLLSKGGAATPRDATAAVSRGTILLRGGFDVDTMGAVIDYAGTLGRSVDRALEACGAALRVVSVSGADSSRLLPLAECLVRSALSDREFASLVSAATRARSFGVLRDDFVRLVIGVLDQGGGLPGVDRELGRRGRGR